MQDSDDVVDEISEEIANSEESQNNIQLEMDSEEEESADRNINQ